MIEQGFTLRAWSVATNRGERRTALKLSKKTSRGERYYVAHAPYTGANFADVEFTDPILLLK